MERRAAPQTEGCGKRVLGTGRVFSVRRQYTEGIRETWILLSALPLNSYTSPMPPTESTWTEPVCSPLSLFLTLIDSTHPLLYHTPTSVIVEPAFPLEGLNVGLKDGEGV